MKIKSVKVQEYGGPEALELVETELAAPGPQEVLVRLKAASVNPVDTYQRAASRGYRLGLPFTPGLDGAGTVEAVGDAVNRFSPGDRVYLAGSISGTYAEAALCREDQLYPIPAGLDYKQAAALYVNYFTAFRALFQRGKVLPGEKALVHGASGGVGIAAMQGLSWKEVSFAATAGTPEGIKLAASQGAAFTADHHDPQHGEDLLKQNGGGFDLIIEMSATDNLDEDLKMLALGGRVVIIGNRGTVEIDPRMLMRSDADIRGMILMNASRQERDELAKLIEEAASAGFIKPVIRKSFPLKDAPEAHRLVSSPGAAGKIIIET